MLKGSSLSEKVQMLTRISPGLAMPGDVQLKDPLHEVEAACYEKGVYAYEYQCKLPLA